jgi:hypothetical protein
MKLHAAVPVAKRVFGVEVNAHVIAFELKPNPLTATTVPPTPVVGLTEMKGTSVNGADTMSIPGLPVTVTVQGDPSAVASELTRKVPVAVPPLMEHEEELMSAAPFVVTLGLEVTVHELSVLSSPLPTNEIV